MANLLERSILMTLGAAMLTKEMAESLADSLAQKGGETTALGREAVDEAVDKAKEEARTLRDRFDDTIQRNFRELGLAPSTEIEELKLKVAQLEHRISLLEADSPKSQPIGTVPPATSAEEGVIGEAEARSPETAATVVTAEETAAAAAKTEGEATSKEG
ncbi:MAG: phasin family protein [Thermoleophilia bacterium]